MGPKDSTIPSPACGEFHFVRALKGQYVTAEDVGTSISDMAANGSSRFHLECSPFWSGHAGNAAQPTW